MSIFDGRRLLWLLAMLVPFACTAAYAAGEIRELPFPHSHFVTFVSDVDDQLPWYGAALHNQLNEELGLPISDSLWVHGSAPGLSYLFRAPGELHREPSGVDDHATFALLLRQWKRGNIDFFHSWQDDAQRPLVNILPNPLQLREGRGTLEISRTTQSFPVAAVSPFDYRHLRMHFSEPPPSDLRIVAEDVRGARAVFTLPKFVEIPDNRDPGGTSRAYVIELLLEPPARRNTRAVPPSFDFGKVRQLEFVSASCSNCSLGLFRLERDSFSRATVVGELPLLERWNVRPAVVTAHGGDSYSQNLGRGYCIGANGIPSFDQAVPETGELRCRSGVPAQAHPTASYSKSHAYHSDILRHLGVDSIWEIAYGHDPPSTIMWKTEPSWAGVPGTSFYQLPRTIFNSVDNGSEETFVASLLESEPLLHGVDLRQLFCGQPLCIHVHQGAMAGVAIAVSLQRIAAGQKVKHAWMTHFGSTHAFPNFQPSVSQPLPAPILQWFRRLAVAYYGAKVGFPLDQRVWVPPVSTLMRYGVILPQLEGRVTVDPVDSRVTINSWTDPVTGRPIPDTAAGSRDLHGVTIYVPDAATATVVIDGAPLRAFTRNPPDQTGKASVTIVDDHTPTVLLDEVSLARSGQIRLRNSKFTDVLRRPNAAYGEKYASMSVVAAGEAFVEFAPAALDLFNITHLHLAFRRRLTPSSTARLRVELEMHNRPGVIALEEGVPGQLPAGAASAWTIPRQPGNDWHYVTLALDQLGMADGAGTPLPALPLGRIASIRFRLLDAEANDEIDIDGLWALRPDGTAIAPGDKKFITGRVTQSGGRAVSATVDLVAEDGTVRQTATDAQGYYFFHGLAKGAKVAISAKGLYQVCTPLRGDLLDLRKDEAEIDIEMDAGSNQCRPF